MDDIIERLRGSIPGDPDYKLKLISDAADEIERLREAVDEYKHRLHWANEELLKRGRP